MSKKEKFDMLMSMAEFNINQFNERRNHSWKVTLTVWAALIGTTGLLDSIPRIESCWIIIGAIFFVGLYFFFIKKVSESAKKDKEVAYKARDLAIDCIGEKELIAVRPPYTIGSRNFWGDWSATFQIGITAFLAIIACLILVPCS